MTKLTCGWCVGAVSGCSLCTGWGWHRGRGQPRLCFDICRRVGHGGALPSAICNIEPTREKVSKTS